MLPYLVVHLISARVPLISTRVSAHCQAILLINVTLGIGSVPDSTSLVLNQCWIIVNCTLKKRLQCNFTQNIKIFFKANNKMHLKMSSAKWQLFCSLDTQYLVYAGQVCLIQSPPSAAYIHQWILSALVQIMARRLFGAKPLSKPMLGYCQLDP